MRHRQLLALCGPALLMLSGCTSDLPAPYNFDVLEPPPPDNELMVDCSELPLTAEGARYAQSPNITGLNEEFTYRYSVVGELPAGLMIDEATGEITGTVEADAGAYTFDVLVEDTVDPDMYSAVGMCTLQVRERIVAPLALDAVPYCVPATTDLRTLVVEGTGDGTDIECDAPGGNGNGRIPNGVQVDPDSCTVTGTIQEDRYGTWAFMVRGTQSGAEVYVPYCITNDEPQGYEITASHSGIDDAALIPVMRTYDPTMPFAVGGDGDPRYEVTSPGICGASCFYRYSFLRTNAPLENFALNPDGLVQDNAGQSVGFFHEMRIDGPAVDAEFLERPWILSVAVSYCISSDEDGCEDVAAQGDGAIETALIMVPN